MVKDLSFVCGKQREAGIMKTWIEPKSAIHPDDGLPHIASGPRIDFLKENNVFFPQYGFEND